LFFNLFILNFAFSQSTQNQYYCTYNFPKNLNTGDSGPDVLELQKFLNSDSRSMLAQVGPGSPSRETNLFGFKTGNSLRRFQEMQLSKGLFITAEFDEPTRAFINKICAANKIYFDSKNLQTTGSLFPIPKITLSSNSSTFKDGMEFRVFLKSTTPIKKIDASSLIIDGGNLNAIRKLSPKDFVLLISPLENSKKIYIQVEADRVSDINNVLNDEASNEVELTKANPPTTPVLDTFTNIINSFIPDSLLTPNTQTYVNPNLTLLSKADLIVYLNQLRDSFATNDETLKNYTYVDPAQSVFSSEDPYNLYGTISLDGQSQFAFNDANYPKNLGIFEPTNPNFLLLKRLEFLKPTDRASNWNMNQQFKREWFNSTSQSCARIITKSGNLLYSLFEKGDKYDYKYFYAPNESSKLLLYPRLNYNFWSSNCFTEQPLESRYFPEGLYCCTAEPCNAKENIKPITYVNKQQQQQLERMAFTTEFSYGAGPATQCAGLTILNGIRKSEVKPEYMNDH
jgi:hypothetical protein